MPFKSKAQMRYLFATHPKVAKEFADKTPDMDELPQHVKPDFKMKKRKKKKSKGY